MVRILRTMVSGGVNRVPLHIYSLLEKLFPYVAQVPQHELLLIRQPKITLVFFLEINAHLAVSEFRFQLFQVTTHAINFFND
jgi:hypothetical protein